MKFEITEAEARAMAEFEEEAGCDVGAGADWGINLDKVMELSLNRVERGSFIELLSEQFGNVLSRDEIEEVAASFQIQIQERLASKVRR